MRLYVEVGREPALTSPLASDLSLRKAPGTNLGMISRQKNPALPLLLLSPETERSSLEKMANSTLNQ